MTLLSLIIPAYNEAESLPDLLEDIHTTVKMHRYAVEIIFVNDGSTDATAEILNALATQSALTVHVIHFSGNRGKAEALTAGFQKASGDIIITMDADLQDNPAEIPKLLSTLQKENLDLVSGWKFPRKDPLEKRAFSFIFNRVAAMLTGVKLHDMNCGFKAYRAAVVQDLHLYGDLHRYIPILVRAAGFSVGEVKVEHRSRRFGRSKYGFERIPKGFFDLITVLFLTKNKKRPMHFFASLGSLFVCCGGVLLLLPAFLGFLKTDVSSLPFWISGGLCIVTSVVLFTVGLLSELLVALLTKDNKQ